VSKVSSVVCRSPNSLHQRLLLVVTPAREKKKNQQQPGNLDQSHDLLAMIYFLLLAVDWLMFPPPCFRLPLCSRHELSCQLQLLVQRPKLVQAHFHGDHRPSGTT